MGMPVLIYGKSGSGKAAALKILARTKYFL